MKKCFKMEKPPMFEERGLNTCISKMFENRIVEGGLFAL